MSVFEDLTSADAVSASRDYQTDFTPGALVVGDFNGDGLDDVATANYGPTQGITRKGSVSVLYNRGARMLESMTDFPIPGTGHYGGTVDRWLSQIYLLPIDGVPNLLIGEGRNLYLMRRDGAGFDTPEFVAEGLSLALEDFDDDGNEDNLALVGIGLYEVQLGDGTGAFHPTTPFTLESWPSLMDFDGDGLPDILVRMSDGELAVRRNQGAGRFGAAERLGIVRPSIQSGFATGADLDGKRGDELILGLNGPGRADTLEIWENWQGRELRNPVRVVRPLEGAFEHPDEHPSGVNVVDLNHDARLDLVLLIRTGEGGSGYLEVFLQGEHGSWTAMPTIYVGVEPAGFVLEDFDLDGNLDVAIAETNSNDQGRTRILRGLGDGGFEPVGIYYPGEYPIGIVSADFDHDGRPDLALACARRGTVALHIQREPDARAATRSGHRRTRGGRRGHRARRVVGAERSRCAGREGRARPPLGGYGRRAGAAFGMAGGG